MTNEHFCCPLSQFDDDFEGKPNYPDDSQEEMHEKAMKLYVSYLREDLKMVSPELNEDALDEFVTYDGKIDFIKIHDLVRKHRPGWSEEELVGNIENYKIVLKEIEPGKVQSSLATVYEKVNLARENIRAICFIPNLHSQIMWRYYAHNFGGYCMMFDVNEISKCYSIFPVIYGKRDEAASLLTQELLVGLNCGFSFTQAIKQAFQRLVDLAYVKDEEWSFQQEWRITSLWNKTHLELPAPKAIFLGENVTAAQKEMIMNSINKDVTEVLMHIPNMPFANELVFSENVR